MHALSRYQFERTISMDASRIRFIEYNDVAQGGCNTPLMEIQP